MYNFADVATAIVKLPQFAGGLQLGLQGRRKLVGGLQSELQGCRNLQEVCNWDCKVATNFREVYNRNCKVAADRRRFTIGIVRLLQVAGRKHLELQG